MSRIVLILVMLAATAGAVLAFVNPWIGCALYLAVAVMWLVPDTRIEHAMKRE